jgi:6,7-dimethyl-8-ribityllumazine synthase
LPAGVDHEHGARAVAGADEDVLDAHGAVEVPLAHRALLAFDDRDALAVEDEEVLLHRLGVVAAVA